MLNVSQLDCETHPCPIPSLIFPSLRATAAVISAQTFHLSALAAATAVVQAASAAPDLAVHVRGMELQGQETESSLTVVAAFVDSATTAAHARARARAKTNAVSRPLDDKGSLFAAERPWKNLVAGLQFKRLPFDIR